MGSVLPFLTQAQRQWEATGTSGDLVEFKLVQKRKAAHKSLKRWFKYDTTLHRFESWDLFSLCVQRREGAGAGLQPYILPGMLGAKGQFPYNLAKVRMSWLLKQWKCRVLLSYLFFFFQSWYWKTTGRDCFLVPLIHLPHDNLLLLQKFIQSREACSCLLSCISLLTFCIWLLFDSWSARKAGG